tara:strand:- start:4526 stop:6889 length:2364 start_codon:yes stop_codon:yes gene_type:complete
LIFDLKSITDIENWSLNSKNLTKNQEKFSEYFKLLGEIYITFKEELKKKKRATNGMIYKSIACNCEVYLNKTSNAYFIGLNALSKAEEKIIDYLVKSNKAKVIFDGDEFYAKNKNHEAGFFYRKYNFNQPSSLSKNITTKNKNFNFYSAKTNQEQISFVRTILNQFPANKKSVIYLMDENMAGPLQQNLNIKNQCINFTMGLPINQSEVFTLTSILFESLSLKNREKNFQKGLFHFDLVSKIISLKTLKKKIGIDFMSSEKWKKSINKNSLYFDDEWIKKHLKNILSVFKIRPLLNAKKGGVILNKLDIYFNNITLLYQKNDLELYVIKQYIDIIKKLISLIKKTKEEISSQLIIKILIQEGKKIKLPTSGDPYNGIQVMGFLESRMLDFDNIIYLSCNETFLPKSNFDQSFFPNDLKKHYGLPGIYEKDALYSYYFYRSLHCVQNAHFIYVESKSSGLKSSEKSRYINQLNLELRLKNIKFLNHIKKPWRKPKTLLTKQNKTLDKKLIERWISSRISPSSINIFSTCSLDFYNKYLIRINEEKIIENKISPSIWGNIIHLVLEELFYEGLEVNDSSLNMMLKDYQNLLIKKLNESFNDNRYLKGQNGLLFRQFDQCIKMLIKNEIKQVNDYGAFKVLHTEHPVTHQFQIPFNGKKIKAKLKGKIDRIDKTSKGLRILDYKTGYFQKSDVNIDCYDTLFNKDKALQLVFYAYLFLKENKSINSVSSGIISIKNPRSNKLMFESNKNQLISREIITIFESKLIDLIGSMNNDEFKFEHNLNSKYCLMC